MHTKPRGRATARDSGSTAVYHTTPGMVFTSLTRVMPPGAQQLSGPTHTYVLLSKKLLECHGRNPPPSLGTLILSKHK